MRLRQANQEDATSKNGPINYQKIKHFLETQDIVTRPSMLLGRVMGQTRNNEEARKTAMNDWYSGAKKLYDNITKNNQS